MKSHLRRTTSVPSLITALVIALLGGLLTAGPAGAHGDTATGRSSDPAGRTTGATYRSVALPAPTVQPDTAGRGTTPTRTAVLTLRHTTSFGLVGLTWDQGTGGTKVVADVRTRDADGWSGWTRLEVDPENDGEDAAPASSFDSTSGRAGTEPLWVGTATGVQARVSAPAGTPVPAGVRLSLVASGSAPTPAATPASPDSARVAADSSLGSPYYTAMPSIIYRSQWGARANRSCDQPNFGPTELGVIVHHTVGSNSYSRAQSAGIVRSIQAYHMDGRGWCDIGYNFLVDKYGQVFEGRNGKVINQVRGAHAGNFDVNTYATGIAMMGNLDTAYPSPAMREAMVRTVGWRIGTFYLDPTKYYALDGHSLAVISGHRDVHNRGFSPSTATACPGRYGYEWLNARGGLRDQVASYVSRYRTSIKLKYEELGRSFTGPVYALETPYGVGYRTRFTNGDIYWISRETGARYIAGPVKTELAADGGATGPLGFPDGDRVNVSTDHAEQSFQHGTIYRVGDLAYALTTRVDDVYRGRGGFASDLGDPTHRTITRGDDDIATFVHGWVEVDRTTGATTVKIK